jgi:hypothetical protein
VSAVWLMRANRFVWHVADAAFDAVVDADLADGAEGFVIESGDTQRGSQFFVELAQIFEVRGQGRKLQAFVGQKKLLVAGVPEAGEAAFEHDRGRDGHLIEIVGAFAKFGAAAVLFDAHDAARAANGKAQRREILHLLRCELLFDIPHGALSLVNGGSSVK